MEPNPPLNYATPLENPDVVHLRLLSIFHYVAAGLIALFGCIWMIYIVLGALVVSGKMQNVQTSHHVPPPDIGYLFVGIGIVMIVLFWTLAVLLFLSGRFMSKRRNRVFSIVIACLSCMWFPFGTILGVFTLVVLVRPSVKFVYGE